MPKPKRQGERTAFVTRVGQKQDELTGICDFWPVVTITLNPNVAQRYDGRTQHGKVNHTNAQKLVAIAVAKQTASVFSSRSYFDMSYLFG